MNIPPHPRQNWSDHFNWMVFDDRDRRVECVHGLRRRSFMKQAEHRASHSLLVKSLIARPVSMLIRGLLALLALELVILLAQMVWYLVGDSVYLFIPVIFALTLTTMLIAIVRGTAGVWTRERAEVRSVLAHGYCLQCLYNLDGLPAHPDGCTVCPECGAAWRLGQDHATTPGQGQ